MMSLAERLLGEGNMTLLCLMPNMLHSSMLRVSFIGYQEKSEEDTAYACY